MTSPQLRSAVVREAFTWQRTPFVYGAAVKGAGVDCGRFIASCLNDAGARAIDVAGLPHLSPQWFLHRADGSLINQIKLYAEEYRLASDSMRELWGGPVKPRPEPADIVVAKCGRDWAHCALVIDWPRVIGAAMEHCVTIWGDIHRSPQYMNRDLAFFDPWGGTNV